MQRALYSKAPLTPTHKHRLTLYEYLASRALDALAAEWEGTTTLAQDEELLAGAALSARGRTFVQFRALRKRVIAANRAALKGLVEELLHQRRLKTVVQQNDGEDTADAVEPEENDDEDGEESDEGD